MQRFLRRLLRWICSVGAVLTAVTVGINLWMTQRAASRIHTDPARTPAAAVGIVLGTSRTVGNGRENAHFRVRMDSAAALYKAGKVRHFLLSGDNAEAHYNEPKDMMEALMARGIPASAMTGDAAGLRTLDSMIRARENFGITRCLIISDDFHLPRALWLADRHGIKADAFVVRPLPWSVSGRSRAREWLARVKAVIDELTDKEPAVTGPRVKLPVKAT